MTEVISITPPDGNSHFGSPVHHSSSPTSLFLQNASSYSRSSSHLKQRYTAVGCDTSKFSSSLPSSACSSPRFNVPEFSNQPSYTSTPSSSLSLDEQCQAEEEDVLFPAYDDGGYYDEMKDAGPLSSPEPLGLDAVTKSANDSVLAEPAHPRNPHVRFSAGDDTAIEIEPTRHVDYLSHNWKEEDIWASWRHIVAKRKTYGNSARLENASWRTWVKSKYQLGTVSPETLNWWASLPSIPCLLGADFH